MGSVGRNNTFSSTEEFESTISDYNDVRAIAFQDAYSEESNYTRGLRNNIERSIDDEGYSQSTEDILNSEKRYTQQQINNLPASKTPEQLGRYEAFRERLAEIERLKKNRGRKASNRDVDIVTYRE